MNIHTRKTVVATTAIICLTVLIIFGTLDGTAETACITGIIGIVMYIIGNGVAAATGREVEPLIRRNRTARTRFYDEETSR